MATQNGSGCESEHLRDPDGPSEPPLVYIDGSDTTWLQETRLPTVNDPKLHNDCTAVLELLKEQNLDFGRFVWAVNYGNEASRQSQLMRNACSQFCGEYLSPTLHNIRIPPRTKHNGPCAKGAKEEVDAFALLLVGLKLHQEMRDFAKAYSGVKASALSERDLLEAINFDSIEDKVHKFAPTLFMVLYMLGTCIFRGGRWQSNGANADFFVILVIACLAYQMSSSNNTLQRLLGIYFKAEHVPTAVVNMLSQLNLCMSYSSTIKSLADVADSVRHCSLEAVDKLPVLFVHDNLRIKRAVRSQRSNNQTVTDNGTAMSVIILPESSRPAWESPEDVRALCSRLENQRALGTPSCLSFSELVNGQRQARVFQHRLYHFFQILRSIPLLDGVQILSNNLLFRPPGSHDLASGPEHITCQYMLGTRPIDRTSYSGCCNPPDSFLSSVCLSLV
ncbi:hypothetical protein BDV93DRAFT_565628 [Ceratobasidium sp. AG-I]|nr:hypothetical protein BDV93DRAFT_565628 [Ceratobasidium sp. AG-I]